MQQCPDGYHQAQHARSVIVAERLIEKQLTPNQMFDSRQNAAWGPQPKSLPIYISWYINGYGRPWTSVEARALTAANVARRIGKQTSARQRICSLQLRCHGAKRDCHNLRTVPEVDRALRF